MLTQETKRKIDSARQILVGKVPDPKAQIDQITTALIYKFMDDMDKDAMELGGKARFFTNGFEKYTWSKILDPKLGGHERLELYAEAITKLWQNNHLPQLFRDIFKDAFLPYRSPETLSLFLKEINGFTYNHSEDLGDAFEYLLSIMSSQGDAGQFRTPRHIIDFIVEVVNPKKDESILDPACGTAGFLISAYKHILKQHDGKDDPERKEKLLTPDDKKKLMNNLVGYDISPDMVKLSKVNMYLHGFAEPKIYEYDTLSSDEKWDEMYDVIMANPPFMSPKGGIRPHKRFSVQANRAEVLFVDYIKEHLRPNGRAGVIVPEGIIFQSGTAYKQLRKLLVEDGLFAVVSLPAGVFNPYSGVKTSILFFDNSLAKLAQKIIFVKVSNDGYDLGAQRRVLETNDLPITVKILKRFAQTIKLGEEFVLSESETSFIQLATKEKIVQSGDYNLTGDRYKEVSFSVDEKYPLVLLGDVCDFSGGSQPPKSQFIYEPKDGYVRFIQIRDFGENGVETYIPISPRNKLCEKDDVFIARYGASLGRICTGLMGAYNVALLKAIPDTSKIDKRFLFYLLQSDYIQEKIRQYGARAAQAGVTPADLKLVKIPLPSLEEQEKLVQYVESLQQAIGVNEQENVLVSKLRVETLKSMWQSQQDGVRQLTSREELFFVNSFSSCLRSIELMSKQDETHIFFESLILYLRELSAYMQRYFPSDVSSDMVQKIKRVVTIRNIICHRSSGLSFLNQSLIVQGGFNIKDEDIEIQYGKTKLYLLADVVSLYKEFRNIVANSSLLGRLAKHPSWQIDERKLSQIEVNIVGNIKSNIMKRLSEN